MASRELTPCIKCNPQMWEYVRPILRDLGFPIRWTNNRPSDWASYPYLVTDYCRVPTHVSFTASSYGRELFIDVEDFLEAAAKLIGKTYIKKYTMNKFTKKDIKPGMVVRVRAGYYYIAIPVGEGVINLVRGDGFLYLDDYKEDLTDPESYIPDLYDIMEVRVPNANSKSLNDLFNDPTASTIIWKRSKKKKVSFEEVAQKFGVDPSELEIETTEGSYLSK